MADIGSLVANLMVNSAQYNRDLNTAARKTKSFSAKSNRALAKVTQKWKGITSAVFSYRGALVAAAGATALGYFIKRNLDAADAIGKTADKIGITTNKLQEYRFMANRAGVDTAQLDKGLEQFVKRLGELKVGTGTLVTYLNKLDEEFKNQLIAAKSTNEALDIYMDKMTGLTSASDKAALSAAGFGRSGVSLVNIVRGGSVEVEKLRKTFSDLGLAIDEDLIRNAENANDKLTNLTTVIKTRLTSAVLVLAPEVARVAEAMTNWIKENDNLIRQKIPEYIDKIKTSLIDIYNIHEKLPEGIVGAAGYGLIGKILFGSKVGAVIAALYLVNKQIEKMPSGLKKWMDIVTGATPVTGVLGEDWDVSIGRRKRPKDKLPLLLPPPLPLPSPIIESMEEYIKKAKEMAAIEYAPPFDYEQFIEPMKASLETIYEELTILHQKVDEVWSDLWDKTKDYWDKTKNVISDVWGGIEKYGIGPIRMMITMPMQMATAMKGFVESIEKFPQMIDDFIAGFDYLIDNFPAIMEKFIIGLERFIPAFIARVPDIINALAHQMPKIAMTLITGIIEGIPNIIAAFVAAVPTIIEEIIKQIPKLAAELVKLPTRIAGGLFEKIPIIGKPITEIIRKIPIIGKFFHEGGIVGKTATPHMALPANVFANAPSYKTGLTPNEFPAILHRGEGVFTPEQMAAMGHGTNVNITLHNDGVITTENVDEWLADRITRLRKNKIGEEFSMTDMATAGIAI